MRVVPVKETWEWWKVTCRPSAARSASSAAWSGMNRAVASAIEPVELFETFADARSSTTELGAGASSSTPTTEVGQRGSCGVRPIAVSTVRLLQSTSRRAWRASYAGRQARATAASWSLSSTLRGRRGWNAVERTTVPYQ